VTRKVRIKITALISRITVISLFCHVSEIIIFKRPHDKIGMNVEELALAAIVEAG